MDRLTEHGTADLNSNADTEDIKEQSLPPGWIDNQSYFRGSFTLQTEQDASWYVLTGLAQAARWPNGKDPVMV
jgi:hypothetical protein